MRKMTMSKMLTTGRGPDGGPPTDDATQSTENRSAVQAAMAEARAYAETAEGFFGGLISPQSVATTAAVTNHSVYEPRLTTVPPTAGYDKVPHTVYFYYVRMDTDGKLRVRHYTKSTDPQH